MGSLPYLFICSHNITIFNAYIFFHTFPSNFNFKLLSPINFSF